jgi:PKD repeat protein
MRKLYLGICFFALQLVSYSQSYEWAKNLGGSGFDFGQSVDVDKNKNVYSVGRFQGTSDLDPGPSISNFSSNGVDDIYISKLDSNGNYLWAKSFGGPGAESVYSIQTERNGFIYVIGCYEDTVDFDPGIGVNNLISNGSTDIFILKLDSSGNFIWVKGMGGWDTDIGYSIAIDTNENVYSTGYFKSTVDFNPNTGLFNLTSNGNQDIFIQKLDSSGNFLWAKSLGGSDTDKGNYIDTDNYGNFYITGDFKSATIDFDPGLGISSHSSNGDYDIFVIKLDSNGSLIWSKTMGSSSYDYGNSLDIDDQGNVYTTGGFRLSMDFDPGAGTYFLGSMGLLDVYVQKLDSSGNFLWAKSYGSTGFDLGESIEVDGNGNVYTTGYFNETVDFDPNTNTLLLVSNGGIDAFIQKLDSNGNIAWAKNYGGPTQDISESLALDNYGNIYTTGHFGNTSDFDPNIGIANIASFGGLDGFILKLSTCISDNVIDTRTECDSLTWIDGITYSSTNNTATFTLTSSGGCDSLVTLDLTIINSTAGTDTITECDSITWIDGNTYIANNSTATFNIVAGAANGCDSLVTLNLTINQSPNASYTEINNGIGNHSFTNTSSGNYNQSHWAFGDGNTLTTSNPNYTFSANGTYVVVLTINDSTFSGSCFDYFLDTIIVTGVPTPAQCTAGFVMYPDTATGDVTVVNSSTGNNITYTWDFGDGSPTSPLFNPSYTYATSGPFYLCLTINDGSGCIDMYCDSIGVNGVVFKQAGFTINVIGTSIITDINEVIDVNTEFLIYPNPTSHQLTIVSELELNQINILNITGQKVKTITTQFNTIDVSELPSGIYFIELITDEKTITQKFVKE